MNAEAAAASIFCVIPSTSWGLLRKSWNSLKRPCPGVPPKADGWRSERSKRNVCA